MERKLAAILCADVHGYSRLMGENEEATLHTLTSHRKLIDSQIENHHGRFVSSAGDSVLAEFASVVEAVNCAVEIQTGIKAENASIPPERRMEFRIGVNLGDVMVEGEQIYGDGVNVAARLESLAEAGGICISGTAYDHVRDKLALGYEDRGEQAVKNIARPVHVWRVLLNGATAADGKTRQLPRRYWPGGVLSLSGLAIVIGTIVLVQHLSLKPPRTSASIPPGQSPALPLPDKPSIAVLPFANMSDDPKQEYFSDGITDSDIIFQWSHDPHGLDRALQLEQQSIALDNSNALAYAMLSQLYHLTRQYDLSIAAAAHAVAFDPNLAFGYASMALALTSSGKPAEAVVAAQKAIRLDPSHRDLYSLYEGTAYMVMGRYEEAIPLMKTYLAGYSTAAGSRLILIACYVELGRNEEARAEAAEVMRMDPHFSLAVQKQMSLFNEPLRDRLYADMAKAGLK